MKKQWKKIADFKYSLWTDEKKVGEMEIHFNTLATKATCTIGDKELTIKRTGFWKSTIEVTDSNDIVVLKTYPEKWYANSSIIEVGNKKYKLIIRNNPLAEYVIKENDTDILAYGLDTENKKLKIKIISSDDLNPILDFLLWYLFVPIANENFGDNFLLLIA